MPGRRLPHSPRRALALLLAVTVALVLPAGALAAAPRQRAAYNQEIQQFMCVACHESLAVAQSPESFSERQYVRTLIAQGDTPAQIKQAMVAAYTTAVLALPPSSGFSVLVYILPPVLVLIGIVTIVFTVPKWRRRAREAAPLAAPEPPTADDTRRLNEDLGRFA